MMENKTKIELKNKSIFITGVAGFIGSNLAKRLLSTVEGVKVVGLDNMNNYYDVRLKEARLKELEQFEKFSFVKGNLADKAVIESIFEQYKPEIVVNLGAQAGVRYSITNPDAYVEANLIGFYNILEACRHSYDEGHTPVEHLVYASSSSVYASISFQLSFINHKSDMSEYNKVIQIEPQHDQFDDVRMEYAQMLKQQLAKGNNGLVRTKYITFSIEAKSVREAKPRLERIETDILNNFKVLGVKAYPLNGVERLQIMYETFHQEEQQKFDFNYDRILQSGMTTKDFIAPTSFLFKSGKDFMMGDTYGAASGMTRIS